MKILRKVFAPFFWLRDIRDVMEELRRIQLGKAMLDVRLSPLSFESKKLLIGFMGMKEQQGKNGLEDSVKRAADLLNSLKHNG